MIYDELRIVDLTEGIAGAYCAKLMTDLGADVVFTTPVADPLFTHRPGVSTSGDAASHVPSGEKAKASASPSTRMRRTSAPCWSSSFGFFDARR